MESTSPPRLRSALPHGDSTAKVQTLMSGDGDSPISEHHFNIPEQQSVSQLQRNRIILS